MAHNLCMQTNQGSEPPRDRLDRVVSHLQQDTDVACVQHLALVLRLYGEYLAAEAEAVGIPMWRLQDSGHADEQTRTGMHTVVARLTEQLGLSSSSGHHVVIWHGSLLRALRDTDMYILLSGLQLDNSVKSGETSVCVTCVCLAVILGDVALLHIFLSHGADVNHVGVFCQTHRTCSCMVAKDTCEAYDSCNVISHYATDEPICANGNMEHQINVNAESILLGVTPLYLAVIQHNETMVEALLQCGADIDTPIIGGQTPLGLALTHKRSLAEVLLRKGCHNTKIVSKLDLMRQSLFYCQGMTTSLTSEERNGKLNDFVEFDFGFEQLMMKFELTPFLLAVWDGQLNTVDQLVSAGADVSATCSMLGGAVHLAVDSGSAAMVRRVLDLGCDVNELNKQGSTPLHLAARLPAPDVCEALIKQGALLDLRDKNGETALSSSVYFGCEQNSELLIQHGANLYLADNRGTTPLYWAVFNSRESTLRKLLEAGIDCPLSTFGHFPRNLSMMRKRPLMSWLQTTLSRPKSLQHLCQLRVRELCRQTSRGRSIQPAVDTLPLPAKLLTSIIML